MALRDVSVSCEVAGDPWSLLRDFCASWHPLIETITPEDRGQIRAFTVKGETTVYRERLTWFSDTERTFRYTHLEGIVGADRYDGRLTVTPSVGGASRVTMSARIEATEPRLSAIAEGTEAIFEIGLSALSEMALPTAQQMETSIAVASEPVRIDTLPELALDVTPPRDGPLCLFLHGIGGNRSNWAGQLGLAGSVTRAAALDLRGYGDSSLGPAQSTVDDYCDDIARVADVLGADKLILCGLSYGAWIATAFAERYPDRMAGLILSGGCTGMSEAGKEERDSFRVSREVPLDEGQSPADFAPAVIDVIAGPQATDKAKAAMLASMSAIPVTTYRDALRCFTNPLRRFDFARLAMPVLMMTGEHDRLAPPAEIRSVAGRIHDQCPTPNVRFEVIKGAGHICNVEAPEAYNAPMLEFLQRVTQ